MTKRETHRFFVPGRYPDDAPPPVTHTVELPPPEGSSLAAGGWVIAWPNGETWDTDDHHLVRRD